MASPVATRAGFLASIYGSGFNATPVTVIDAAIAAAVKRTSNVYQSVDVATDAAYLRAAILVLRHPAAYKMRQANPDQLFTWEVELRNIQRSGTIGLRTF